MSRCWHEYSANLHCTRELNHPPPHRDETVADGGAEWLDGDSPQPANDGTLTPPEPPTAD